MATNLPPKGKNNTQEFFDNFFKASESTSQNVNDAVIGFFQNLTGDKDTGTILASTVLMSAAEQGIEPMALIDEFRKLKPRELNAYLTLLLNINRSGTSLLGVTNQPQTSKYISRTILA